MSIEILHPLLQTITIPAITSAIIGIVGRKVGKKAGLISGIGMIWTTAMLFLLVPYVLNNGSYYEEYVWAPIIGLKFGLLADNLSLPVAIIVNFTCIALAFYSMNYIDHRIDVIYKGRDRTSLNVTFHTLYPLFSTGLMGIALSTNLIAIFLFLELMLIPLYFIMYYFGYIERERCALMCFVWGTVGCASFLVGVVGAYLRTHSFEVSALRTLNGNLDSYTIFVSFAILIGILIKMGTFGFHVWVPWVHAEHPTCIAGILAAYLGIANYLFARIIVQYLTSFLKLISLPLMIYALITMVYGALMSIAQDDVKRLCAWSTISQNGYSLLGLASGTILGTTGGIFYFLSHSLGKTILFSLAGILVYQTGIRSMKKMGGLASRMPISAILFIAASMILSAMPPLSGFPAELILFTGIFVQGTFGDLTKLIVVMIGIFATFLTTVYTFWPARRIFFGPLPKNLEDIKEAPLSMLIPLLLLVLVSFILGVYPSAIMQFFNSYANFLPLGR